MTAEMSDITNGRARRRRDLRDAAIRRHPANYSPAVPRYRLLTQPIRQDLYEQVKRRQPKGMSFQIYLETLLEAACELIDHAAPEPAIKLATHVPPGLEEAARRLQALKTGTADGPR